MKRTYKDVDYIIEVSDRQGATYTVFFKDGTRKTYADDTPAYMERFWDNHMQFDVFYKEDKRFAVCARYVPAWLLSNPTERKEYADYINRVRASFKEATI